MQARAQGAVEDHARKLAQMGWQQKNAIAVQRPIGFDSNEM
jgi:outer membrane protease